MLSTNFNTLCLLLGLLSTLSQAQNTTPSLSKNISDSDLVASLIPTDSNNVVDKLPIPRNPHSESYTEYSLYYSHYGSPYVPADDAERFLTFCNVLFMNKLLAIATATKGSTVPTTQWPFFCSNSKLFGPLELELWPSSRQTSASVPLRYIPSLMYHMYGFDARWEPDCIPYYANAAVTGNEPSSPENSTTITKSNVAKNPGSVDYERGVPSFEVELRTIDGPDLLFAVFRGERSYRGSQGNGTVGSYRPISGLNSTGEEAAAA